MKKSGVIQFGERIEQFLIGHVEFRGGVREIRIHLKNAVTSQTVTHLVDKGLMCRVNADDDRRKVIISLTERGREIAEGIATLADRFLEKYLSVLTDKEFATLVQLAKKLNPELPY